MAGVAEVCSLSCARQLLQRLLLRYDHLIVLLASIGHPVDLHVRAQREPVHVLVLHGVLDLDLLYGDVLHVSGLVLARGLQCGGRRLLQFVVLLL